MEARETIIEDLKESIKYKDWTHGFEILQNIVIDEVSVINLCVDEEGFYHMNYFMKNPLNGFWMVSVDVSEGQITEIFEWIKKRIEI